MTYASAFGGLSGHRSQPQDGAPWPVVIVVHEWWGLDDQTRSIADRIASLGYLVFAPDLYSGESAVLHDGTTATALVQKYAAMAPAALADAFDALKADPGCNGRIGCVGFCFGGRMALALGLLRPLDAVCTFYGGQMQLLFDQFHALKAPVLALFGDQDPSIPSGTIAALEQVLERNRIEHEIVVYPDSGHAFFRDRDPSVYKPVAAADAWRRLVAFLSDKLSSPPSGWS